MKSLIDDSVITCDAWHAKDFDESKCKSFWLKIMACCKYSIKSGIKETIVLKKDLIVNQFRAKFYEGKFSINFHCEGMLKEGSHCICSSVILIYSVFKISKSYCPKALLKTILNKR